MADANWRQIDWDTAHVQRATLTVELRGERRRGWRKHFDEVVRLLAQTSGGWGTVSLDKNVIRVADVLEGSEEALRHLLESAVHQVNADLAPEVAVTDRAPTADRQTALDRRITAAFRAFAEP